MFFKERHTPVKIAGIGLILARNCDAALGQSLAVHDGRCSRTDCCRTVLLRGESHWCDWSVSPVGWTAEASGPKTCESRREDRSPPECPCRRPSWRAWSIHTPASSESSDDSDRRSWRRQPRQTRTASRGSFAGASQCHRSRLGSCRTMPIRRCHERRRTSRQIQGSHKPRDTGRPAPCLRVPMEVSSGGCSCIRNSRSVRLGLLPPGQCPSSLVSVPN